MKRFLLLSLAVLMVLAAVSCGKDGKPGDNDGHEIAVPDGAVDLGIVITRRNGTTYRLFWAKSNLCGNGLCANPEDYGDYYAWGETEPKLNYSLSTYKFGNGESGTFTKYNTADNNTELDSEDDDVAHVKLGGKWRMPTEYEWSVLKNKCNWDEWTDDFNGTGVKGNIVKAKNGNSIFLPAAGCYTGSYYDDKSSFGNYWTSSRNSSSPEYALYASFSSGFFHIGSISRASGYSVRPVWEE